MRTLDEEIADQLKQAVESGELNAAKSYGKPFDLDSGWEETPETLRMSMKILKNAGVPPPEIEMFHERARLKALISSTEGDKKQLLQLKLNELEQHLALRLEALRRDCSR